MGQRDVPEEKQQLENTGKDAENNDAPSVAVEEISSLLDRAISSWGLQLPPVDKAKLAKVWFRYLGEFTFTEIEETIDYFVGVSPRWMPKVGELRRRLIEQREETPLSPAEAWGEYLRWSEEADSGLVPHQLDPHVRDTITRLGNAAAGLFTNKDRDFFIDAYRSTLDRYYTSK